jgi:hypothetical protein
MACNMLSICLINTTHIALRFFYRDNYTKYIFFAKKCQWGKERENIFGGFVN